MLRATGGQATVRRGGIAVGAVVGADATPYMPVGVQEAQGNRRRCDARVVAWAGFGDAVARYQELVLTCVAMVVSADLVRKTRYGHHHTQQCLHIATRTSRYHAMQLEHQHLAWRAIDITVAALPLLLFIAARGAQRERRIRHRRTELGNAATAV